MINKHFLKVLLIFTGMIVLGILGSFIASYLDKSDNSQANVIKSTVEVAK